MATNGQGHGLCPFSYEGGVTLKAFLIVFFLTGLLVGAPGGVLEQKVLVFVYLFVGLLA